MHEAGSPHRSPPPRAIEERRSEAAPVAGGAQSSSRLLQLQRTAGNRAVGRYLARTPAATETGPVDLEYMPGTQLPAASDPRTHSDFIDRRLDAVGYSPYHGFVLFLRDAPNTPVLVPDDHFDFGASGAVAAGPVIHASREDAFAALPVGPLQEGQAVPYALYRAALGLVVPTTLSMATAPRTTATAREASRRYANEVADELVTTALAIVGFKTLTVGLRGLCRYVGGRFERAVMKPPAGRAPQAPAPAATTGPSKSPAPKTEPATTNPLRLMDAPTYRAKVIEALSKLRGGTNQPPEGYVPVVDFLKENPGPANKRLLELLPAVQRALGTPRLYGDRLVVAREVALAQDISIADALWQMSLEGGVRAKTISESAGQLPEGAFFKRYAIERAPIIDEGAGRAHGKLTHPLQDQVITLGLREAGHSETAYDFRALLEHAEGTYQTPKGPVQAGDLVWRVTYDTIDRGHINMPETLVEALGPYGLR